MVAEILPKLCGMHIGFYLVTMDVVPHVCIVYCISSYRDECGGQVLDFNILTSKTYHHHHHY